MDIDEATTCTEELVDAAAALVPQLSRSAPPPGRAALEQIVASPATRLLTARHQGAVVGMLTLVLVRIPTGHRAIIEDVVVDAGARGLGIGEALTRHAIELARTEGARTVDLTSRPDRAAANRLYQRIGFTQRVTNIYRYEV